MVEIKVDGGGVFGGEDEIGVGAEVRLSGEGAGVEEWVG